MPSMKTDMTTMLTSEMFHPPKILQQQWNGNRTGFQRVPISKPLNANVAPIANPFFPTVAHRCWPNGHCWKCNGVINLLHLRLNFLNCNGFAIGCPLQPVGHPVAAATGAVFYD